MPKLKLSKEYNNMLIKIGLNVAYYRKLKSLSQQELSEKANINRTTIANIESADKHYGMTLNTVYRLAEALGIPIKKLFDFRDED